MLQAPVRLVGIDLLELSSAPAPGPLASQILSPRERRAAARDELDIHACLALKEAVVKAVGGRPPGFRWQGVAIGADTSPPGCPKYLVDLVHAVGDENLTAVVVTFVLDGALSGWARSRLSAGEDVELRGAGAWTRTETDEIFAAVAIEPSPGAG